MNFTDELDKINSKPSNAMRFTDELDNIKTINPKRNRFTPEEAKEFTAKPTKPIDKAVQSNGQPIQAKQQFMPVNENDPWYSKAGKGVLNFLADASHKGAVANDLTGAYMRKAAFGDNTYFEDPNTIKTTGNKAGDTASQVVGTVESFFLPSGGGGGNMLSGVRQVGDKWVNAITPFVKGGAVSPLLKKVLGKSLAESLPETVNAGTKSPLLQKAILAGQRGIAESLPVTAQQAFVNKDTPEELAKNALVNAGAGMVGEIGLMGLGAAGKAIFGKNKAVNPLKPSQTPKTAPKTDFYATPEGTIVKDINQAPKLLPAPPKQKPLTQIKYTTYRQPKPDVAVENTVNKVTTFLGEKPVKVAKEKTSSLFPEYNNLSKTELEQLEKDLTQNVNDEYWRFTRSDAVKIPSKAPMMETSSRLNEVRKLLGKQKEFYEITQQQAKSLKSMPPAKHREYVERAIKEGKPVPPEVLKDYPELAPTPQRQFTKSTTTEKGFIQQQGSQQIGQGIASSKTLLPKAKQQDVFKASNKEMPFAVTPAEAAKLKLKPKEPIKTGNATWKNKDFDQPIEVIGDMGEVNGKRYVKIKGSNTGVPLDEVEYAVSAKIDNVKPLEFKTEVNVGKPVDTKQYIATKTAKQNKTIGNVAQKSYASTVDDLYPIKPVNEEAYVKALNSRQSDMIANRSLTTGLVDKNGKVVNESLKEITKQIPMGKELDFVDYLNNRHAPTWLEQGRKVFPDEAGVTADVARAKAAQYEAQFPQFNDLGNRFTKYQQSLAKTWLVDAGIMKPETWDALVKKYPDYVPFQREFADIESKGGIFTKSGFVNQSNPIKKGVGSQRKIIDPIETVIERTGQYIKTAKRNDVMNPIVDELMKNPNAYEGVIKIVPPKSATLSADAIVDVNKILQEEGIDGLINKFNKPWEGQQFIANKGGAVDKGNNIVTVMRNGAPVHLEVNDMDFLKAISNLNPQQATAITRAVGKATGLLKTVTTGINPVFGLARNIWKDLVTGYVNSKTIGANPFGYAQYIWDLTRSVGNTIAEPLGRMEFLPKTFKDIFAKGGEPMTYFKNIGGGGHVSAISSDRNLLAKAKADILPKNTIQKIGSVPGKLYRGLENLNNTLEVAPRLAENKRVLKRGGTIDEALYESQDLTVNFSRKGNVTKEADAFIPYLNAAVQGLDKTVRVFNPASSGGKNVVNSIIKSVYAITIPSMILYAINHADEAYKMLSDYQKDNYFNIPRGDGTFTKIPKPRELGVAFGALPERMMRAFSENDPEAFSRFADTVKQNFMPPTSTVGQPAQDIWKTEEGRDWRGNPIVNQSMTGRDPRYQFDENTSEPAKFVGDLFNLSPKKIDATAKAYLGGVAQIGLPATTKGKSVPDMLKSQFTADPAYNNDIMNDFYSNLDKLQVKANNKDFLSGVSGAADRRQKTAEELKVSMMNQYKKQIDTINKQIKDTNDITQKRNLRLKMLEIAQEANKKFKQ